LQYLITNLTFKILHLYPCQRACKTINKLSTTASSKSNKAFQNHAQQAALDISTIDWSADLCLVSA